MPTVTLRGKEYPIAKVSVVVLSPLLAAMGATEEESTRMAEMAEDDRLAYGNRILKRLSEPTRHYQIAFTLARLFPTVPDDILNYQVWNDGDGRRYEDFTLDLEVEELAELIHAAIAGAKESVQTDDEPAAPPVTPRPKPEGFAPKTKALVPAVIKPEAPAPKPALSADDVAKLEQLSDDAVLELRKAGSYSPLMGAMGVSESLFNYLQRP